MPKSTLFVFYMRSILIILCCMLMFQSARSQKWQPGYFYDIRGIKNPGFINQNPSGKGPIKNEAFIEYKDSEKATPIRLSASDIRSYVADRDSFAVAYPPSDGWAEEQLAFIRVAVNAPLGLYVARSGGSSGGGRGINIHPNVAGGLSTGGYGSGVGGGLAIDIGGGGRRGGGRMGYFYGTNASQLKPITSENFIDVMSEVMGDEPTVVEKIRDKKFSPNNMESLIAYFNKVRASHP
jgi:hypothetical protein